MANGRSVQDKKANPMSARVHRLHQMAWGSTLRAAAELPSRQSIKKVVQAALDDGWSMADPLFDRSHGGVEEQNLPLWAVCRHLPWEDESSELIGALSELGVTWNVPCEGAESGLLALAASRRNWVVVRSMLEGGADTVGVGKDSFSLAMLSKMWADLDGDAWWAGRKDEGRTRVQSVIVDLCKKSLTHAFETGAIEPKHALPLLAASVANSAFLDSGIPASKASVKALLSFLSWGVAQGCVDWSLPIGKPGELPHIFGTAYHLGPVENPTFALSLAHWALRAPEAFARAMDGSTPGLEIDERSAWAMAKSGSERCGEAETWNSLAEAGKGIVAGLRSLDPLRTRLACAHAIPEFSKAESVSDMNMDDGDLSESWAGMCARLCSGGARGFADSSMGRPVESKSKARLMSSIETVAKNAREAIKWMGMDRSHPQWESFVDEFASVFAKNSLLRYSDSYEDEDSNRALILSCSGASLACLCGSLGEDGDELADQCLSALAGAIELLGKQGDFERVASCVELGAELVCSWRWSTPGPRLAIETWSRLCSAALGSIGASGVGKNDSRSLARALALMEDASLRQESAQGHVSKPGALRI